MKKKSKKKINLALQGGGSHGAFTWGVLDKFLETETLEIDAISATSAGAMNAAVLAEGYRKEGREGARKALKEFWYNISEMGESFSPLQKFPLETLLNVNFSHPYAYTMFDAVTRLFSPYVLNPCNINPLKKILIESIDFRKLQKSQAIKLFICATNVKTGKPKIFKKEELSPAVLLASACIPNYFQAVNVEDEYYWDGGYIGNPAIYPLIYETTSSDIVIVHINPINREGVPQNSFEISNRINEISFNAALIRELRVMAFVNRLIDEKWIKPECENKLRKIHTHAIRADNIMCAFGVTTKLRWEWDFLMNLYHLGKNTAEAWLSENSKFIGKKSTLDFKEFS